MAGLAVGDDHLHDGLAGGMLLHRGQLTPGELMIFMTYLGMIYDPLCQITGFRFNLESGLAGARRVFEVFDRDAVVIDSADAISLPLQPRNLPSRPSASNTLPIRKFFSRST